MIVRFRPSALSGTVKAPPSKSMAHRLLICAAHSLGRTRVHGVSPSQDVLATLDCLAALGVSSEWHGDTVEILSPQGLHTGQEGTTLPCRESGSTLRFFLPQCLFGPPMTLTGTPRLMERPQSVYETLCRQRGIRFEQGRTAIQVQGVLQPGIFRLPGDVSSQFVSGMLFALPELTGDSQIQLTGPVESRSYIQMTLSALETFGVQATWEDTRTIHVPGKQTFGLPSGANSAVCVEGDWSNGAFLLALGLQVSGLRQDSLQGDKICAAHFAALDQGPALIDLSDCPDLGPVLMAYAALHHGAQFTGTRRLAIKESDRGAAMQTELARFGVQVDLDWNQITVSGGARYPDGPLFGHNDHRIVMALSVLCARLGGEIRGAEAVAKSYPDFFDRLLDCNADLEVIQDGMDQ